MGQGCRVRARWMGVRLAALIATAALVIAACGGDDDDALPEATAVPTAAPTPTVAPTATPEPADPAPDPTAVEAPDPTPEPAVPGVRTPTELRLNASDAPIILPIPNNPIGEDWTLEEYVFGGEAASYVEVGEVEADGVWDVVEDDTSAYRTRLLVRRPPAEEFSGVVVVEWFNVTSGTDIAPDWGFLDEEIQRRGHAYIGVSAQSVSVNGSDRVFIEGGLLDTRGLVIAGPERYGDLVHPGDRYAFDIFTQAGAVAGDVLAGLEPTHVIAMGESQSAAFMTAYVNGVHPVVGLYDGFLIHSRGGGAPSPSLSGFDFSSGGVLVRTDLETPVFTFESETDVGLLNYAAARQEDTAVFRAWEVAGTAHSDTYTLSKSGGLPRDPALGAVIGCPGLINDGPHHESLQAAVYHLVNWVVDGVEPPTGPRLEIAADGAVVRDESGFALGGIRLPTVDVPLRVLSGDPGVTEGACRLFGQSFEIDGADLVARYGTLTDFVAEFEAAAAVAVESGWLVPEDAEIMVAEETARAERLGLG